MNTQKTGIDILAFNAVSQCENAFELAMLAPDDMTETGVSFLVIGSHADAVKAHFKQKTKAFLTKSAIAEKQGKTEEFTGKLVDAKDQNEIEGAAVRVVGWVGVEQEFTPALLKQVLANNPHWVTQITKCSENIGNFTK